MRACHTRVYRRVPRAKRVLAALLFSASLALCALCLARSAPVAPAALPAKTVYDDTPDERVLRLDAFCFYALQFGAFDSASSASALESTMPGAAFSAHLQGKHRVLGACYDTRAQAQQVQARLAKDNGLSAYVWTLQSAGAQLRVTGQKGQLDVFCDALVFAQAQPDALQTLTLSKERGDTAHEDAAEALRSARYTAQQFKGALERVFPLPMPSAVSPLYAYLDAYARELDACGALPPERLPAALWRLRTCCAVWLTACAQGLTGV